MSLFELTARFGVPTLLRLALWLLCFVVLHLARLPLIGVVWLLEAGMRAVDQRVTTRMAGPPAPYEWRAA